MADVPREKRSPRSIIYNLLYSTTGRYVQVLRPIASHRIACADDNRCDYELSFLFAPMIEPVLSTQ
jgi:hypothetical protein